ncbi:MAG TPA: hypothetical protein PLT49_15190, partial [Ferruginibacter sp.]|nr:hypothetical protein [Ferruginibacter sp.]
TIRMAYASAALDLAVKNKKEEARKMLNKVDKMMLEENFPYGMASRNQQHNYISHLLVQAAYAAEDTVLAAKITRSLKKDLEQQLRYYESLDEQKAEAFDGSRGGGDKVMAEQLLMRLMQFEEQFRTRNNPPAEKGLTIPTQPVTPGAKPDSPKR